MKKTKERKKMKVQGKVLSAKCEERDMVGKDGQKRRLKINHVVILATDGQETEVLSVKSFNDNFKLPKVGENFVSPFRKYETNGGVAEVVV